MTNLLEPLHGSPGPVFFGDREKKPKVWRIIFFGSARERTYEVGDKVRAVERMRVPISLKDYYQIFVLGFGKTTEPLCRLKSKWKRSRRARSAKVQQPN